MRMVYVFAMYGPDDGTYMFRAPKALAWLLCRFRRHLDYALNW